MAIEVQIDRSVGRSVGRPHHPLQSPTSRSTFSFILIQTFHLSVGFHLSFNRTGIKISFNFVLILISKKREKEKSCNKLMEIIMKSIHFFTAIFPNKRRLNEINEMKYPGKLRIKFH